MFKNTVSILSLAISAGLLLASPNADARSLKKMVKDVGRSAAKVVPVVTKPLEKLVEEVVIRPTEQAVAELDRTGERVAKEFDRTAEKVGDEASRGIDNVVEGIEVASKASLDLSLAYVDAQVDAISALSKGEVEAAVRAVTVDHARAAEDIAAAAVIESSALRLVGQVAATAYSGPGGAAAFSGWYGYHASGGDWDAAAKGAAISGAASSVGYGVASIPGDAGLTLSSGIRVAAQGAGSSVVVAAAGGDSEAIRDGFWMGVATGASSETYQATVGIPMSGEVASEGPIAKSDGTPITDYSPNASHVGLDVKSLTDQPQGILGSSKHVFAQENGPAMQAVGKVPGMNRMAYFHDQWMLDTSNLAKLPLYTQLTIPVAMVISYTATGVPLAQKMQDETL